MNVMLSIITLLLQMIACSVMMLMSVNPSKLLGLATSQYHAKDIKFCEGCESPLSPASRSAFLLQVPACSTQILAPKYCRHSRYTCWHGRAYITP